MNLTNLDQDQLNALYTRLLKDLSDYEQDVEDTLKALEDRNIDYMTRKEFQDDLAIDRREITKINDQIAVIYDYIAENGISLDRIDRVRGM